MSILRALIWLQQAVPTPGVPGTAPETVLSTEPSVSNWFIIYIVLMSTAAFLGILLLILILSIKLSQISKQLDELSDSATTFIRIGLDHFKDRTGKRLDKRT